MKKLLGLLLAVFLFGGNFAFAEELPGPDYKRPLNEKDNPIYYKYMNDYLDRLYNAFDASKYRKREWGMGYEYIIHRDGSISDMKRFISENKSYDKYTKKSY